jgi:hypothetical protein
MMALRLGGRHGGWRENLFHLVSDDSTCKCEVFRHIDNAAIALVLMCCVTYDFQSRSPLNNPKITLLSKLLQRFAVIGLKNG